MNSSVETARNEPKREGEDVVMINVESEVNGCQIPYELN